VTPTFHPSSVTVISAAYPAVAVVISVVIMGENLTWLKSLAVLTISGAMCFAL
jgi:drug/metabolite transporter (DMT)-like permease